jgi:hypothetical protein
MLFTREIEHRPNRQSRDGITISILTVKTGAETFGSRIYDISESGSGGGAERIMKGRSEAPRYGIF